MKFSKKTFEYFEGAKRNKNNKKWFEKNEQLYLDHVRGPFTALVESIDRELGHEIPGIKVNPRGVTRPLRQANRAQAEGWVKTHAHLTLWEKQTSRFEWNPGIHLQFGVEKDDNFFGLGLYMVSSRQMGLMRERLSEDYFSFGRILKHKKLRAAWGGLHGDKFVRFPRGYEASAPYGEFFWHKQFYLGQELKRSQVISQGFFSKVVEDLRVAMPFFSYVRATVGTYAGSGKGN